ncbi:HYC_CC_PP family protein [Limnovirga soli]|uniref:Uncharacterized protein n=1 Tax=Limnovirga soli TaxID=2656915 RepID=A0A8J8FGI8_9BACT|nr:hypothetical protein [Limnovirga soli]NNV55441.1 hypothetical protein [Limnovirga soli]
MKKLLVFILSFVYIMAATGASVHIHYCMDKLVAVNFKADTKNCKSCGMAKAKSEGCCKDELAHIKVDKDQLASSFHFNGIGNILAIAMPPQYKPSPAIYFTSLQVQQPVSNAPPPDKLPIYLLKRSFLI